MAVKSPSHVTQQFTMGSLAKASLQKVCRNSAEKQKNVLLRQERVQKFCGKFAEFHENLRNIVCNDPFPNDPTSELLSYQKNLPIGRTLGPNRFSGHKHRVTTPEKPRKISRTPNPAETPENPRRDPRRTLGETPQSPLRGKFPRRASRRVVPLGW